MSVQVEKLEKNMAKLTIEVSAEEFGKAMQKAYQKQKNHISLPGFRKGKAPMAMIEKMYGPQVFYEDAANILMPEAYANAADESGLDIVSQPDIEVTQIEKGKTFIFTAEVAVKPEVVLGGYKGVEVEKKTVEVTDEEIQAELLKEQEKNSRITAVEGRAVENGDLVVLDFEGFVDGEAFQGGKGEQYPLTIGSGAFIPGFEEQLIGAEVDKEVEVNVTFPEDYQAEELKGKAATFKCTVHKIEKKELPELNDDFAKDVSEFDTLEEYKADIKKNIEESKLEDIRRDKEDAVLTKVIEDAQMEIPEAMIETQTRQMMDDFARRMQSQGLTMEQYMQFTGSTLASLQEQMKPQAMQRIQSRLVLEKIAEAENIQIADEKLDEEISKMAEMYNMEVEKLKSVLGDAEKEQMKADMAVQEAVTLIAEAAKEVEKTEE